MLNFHPNLIIPLLAGEKNQTQKIKKKYSHKIFVKKMWYPLVKYGIRGIYYKKPVPGVSETSNLAHN